MANGAPADGLAGLQDEHTGVPIEDLVLTVENQAKQVTDKILAVQANGDDISIGDMFDLQLSMNRLAQISEMSTSVTSAMNGAITTLARNVKG